MLLIKTTIMKGSYFKKLLFSYLFLFIIPLLIIVMVSYTYITPMVYKKDVDYSYKVLVNIVNASDMVLDEVNTMAFNYAVDNDFQKVTKSDVKYDTFFIMQIADRLSTIKHASENIHSVYLYLKGKNKIIDSENKGYFNVDEFYDKAWVDSYSLSENVSSIIPRKMREVSTDGKEYRETYVISIIKELKNHDGAVIFNIRETAFRKVLQDLSDNDGQILVMDREGNIFSRYERDGSASGIKELSYINRIINKEGKGYFSINTNRDEKLISYVESAKYNWIYVSIINVNHLKSTAWNITLILMVVSFLCLLAGISGAFILSKRNYSPVEVLLSNLKNISQKFNDKNQKKMDEFGYINAAINEIISKEEDMKEIFTSNSELAREQFLQKLVNGEMVEPDGLQRNMEYLNILFKYDCFVVMTVEFDEWKKITYYISEQEVIKVKEYLKSIIQKSLASDIYDVKAVNLGLRRMAFILNYNSQLSQDNNTEYLLQIAVAIKKALENAQGSTVSIGVGESVRLVADLFKSYYQSCNALEYTLLYGRNQVLHISDIKRGRAPNCLDMYKVEFSNSNLVELVISMNSQEIIGLFSRTVDRLIQLGAEQIYLRFLFLQYTGMISRIPFELGIDLPMNIMEEAYNDVLQYETIDEMKEYISRISNRIVEAYRKENEKDNANKIVEDAIRYIQQNFNKDLSLEDVAENVYVSKYYLSRIFKQKAGKNFNEYLNHIRIQEAKNLLNDTSLDINAIARKVGYETSNSFGRMFKLKLGITPSQYREKYFKNATNEE